METSPIYPRIDSIFRLEDFIALSLEGFGYATVGERVTETIRRIVGSGSKKHPLGDDKVYKEQKERYQKLSTFARAQGEKGFPYLYTLAVVSLWATLEACVDDVVQFAISRSCDLAEFTHLANVRAPVLSIISASPEELNQFLREALEQEIASPLRVGVGQFEALLGAVHLSGGVTAPVRKALLELKESRNVVLHSQGRVDARFVRQCPWVNLQIGDDVPLSAAKYHQFSSAAFWYLIELNERLRERYGETEIAFEDPSDKARSLQEDLDAAIDAFQRSGKTGAA